MVSCQNSKTLTSPRSALKSGLAGRGVVKHSAANSKAKKVQRALETVFEETAGRTSSPSFFSMRGVLASPPRADGVRKLQRLLPAFGRLRAQEGRELPAQRKATPIKDAAAGLRAGWGRHRLGSRCAVDDLAAELGAACQLQSALKQQQQQHELQQQGAGPQGLGPQGQAWPPGLQGLQHQQQGLLAGPGGTGGVEVAAASGAGSAGCTPAVRAWPRGPGSFALRLAAAAAAAAAAGCNAAAAVAAPPAAAPVAALSPMEPSPIGGLVTLSQPQSQTEPVAVGVPLPLPLTARYMPVEAGAGPGAAMQAGAEAMD